MRYIIILFLFPIIIQAQQLNFLFYDDWGTIYYTMERLDDDEFLVGGRGPDSHASLVRFNSQGDTLGRRKICDCLGNAVTHLTVLEDKSILALLEHGQIIKLSPDLQEIAELHQLRRDYGEDYRVIQVNHTDSLWFITGRFEDSLSVRNHVFTEFDVTGESINTIETMSGRPYPIGGFHLVMDTIYASILEVDTAIYSVWRSVSGALVNVQQLTEKTAHIFGLTEVNSYLYAYGTIKDSILPATFRGWLIKFNQALSVEWQKEYRSSVPSLMNLSSKRFRKIIPYEGGDMLIVGQDVPGTNPYSSHSYIGRYSSKGEVTWDTFYNVHSEIERIVDAVAIGQEKVMAVGYLDSDSGWSLGYLMGISFEITSIDEQKLNSVISPNPFTDHIRIPEDCSDIRVFDMSGRKALETSNRETINLSHLPPGIYILRAGCGSRTISEILVKASSQ